MSGKDGKDGEEVVTEEVVEEEFVDNNGVKHIVKKKIITRKRVETRQVIRDGGTYTTIITNTSGSSADPPEEWLGTNAKASSSPSSEGKDKNSGIRGKLKKLLKGDKDGAEAKSSGTTDSPSSSDSDFEKEVEKWHNIYREKHGVPALKLNAQLSAYAKEWAVELAQKDTMKHRTENTYGENIFMKWSSKDPVESWYNEIKVHEFGREPKSLDSGHFTQVVWKKSRELGVGRAKSKTGKYLVVANYDPPGNFVGSFAENVPPLK